MKLQGFMVMVVCLLLSGCGVDWFPTSDGPFTNNSTNTNPGPTAPTLTKKFNDAAILSGTSTTLTFTIANATSNPAQTGLGFVDRLQSGLTATATPSQCGGNVAFLNSQIVFDSGTLAAGAANCTITATVTGVNSGSEAVTFTNKTSDITTVVGGLVNSVTDQTLKVLPASIADSTGNVVASNMTSSVITSDQNVRSYNVSVDVKNNGSAAISAAVDFIAVDANGVQLQDNGIPIADTFVSDPIQAGQTVHLGPQPEDVPLAAANQLKFWIIKSVVTF